MFGGIFVETNLFNPNQIADIKAGDKFFCQLGREWVVRREGGVEGFNGVEDLERKITQGECISMAGVAKEEADADTINEKVERFTHVIDGRGIVTRRCDAMGGRWGVSQKKCGPSSRRCNLPCRISSWRRTF